MIDERGRQRSTVSLPCRTGVSRAGRTTHESADRHVQPRGTSEAAEGTSAGIAAQLMGSVAGVAANAKAPQQHAATEMNKSERSPVILCNDMPEQRSLRVGYGTHWGRHARLSNADPPRTAGCPASWFKRAKQGGSPSGMSLTCARFEAHLHWCSPRTRQWRPQRGMLVLPAP